MQNATYLLDHYDQNTMRKADGTGFTSILATDGIPMARAYYDAIRERQDAREAAGTLKRRLKVAMIYSFAANGDDVAEGIIADETMSTKGLSASDREALDVAIGDYNALFGTSFSTDGKGFDNYYKDVSMRLKSRELDMLIVVDMFLTGFDSKTLNTLWVDKNLRMHGLIQAFSRTNRILDSVKTFGNIVCFRDLSANVDESLELFGDEEAGGIVLLKPYAEYLSEYLTLVDEIRERFMDDEGRLELLGEDQQKAFVGAFGALLRLRNVLSVFDQFRDDDVVSPRTLQDLQSTYLDLADEFKRVAKADQVDIVDDLVFEIELIRQVEVNIDYILDLVMRARSGNGEDRVAYDKITRAIATSPQLRDKAELILEFVGRMGVTADGATETDDGDEGTRRSKVDAAWSAYVREQVEGELDAIIADEHLKSDETRRVMSYAFDAGGVPETGTLVQACLPRVSRFARGNAYGEQRHRVIARLQAFYDKFKTLIRHYPVDAESNQSCA